MLEAWAIEYARSLQIVADVEIPQVHRKLRISRLTRFGGRIPEEQIASPGLGILNPVRIEFRRRKPVLVVIRVHEECKAHLPEVVQAACLLAILLRARQRGQEHTRQNRDDGDHDQQLDQGEGWPGIPPVTTMEKTCAPETTVSWLHRQSVLHNAHRRVRCSKLLPPHRAANGDRGKVEPHLRPAHILPSAKAAATEIILDAYRAIGAQLGTPTPSSPVCKISKDPSPRPSPMGRGWASGRVR